MNSEWINIDGSQGEGGGQILRTSLSLSMHLGKAVRIGNIRAGRNKPGLLRQHLCCVRAAAEICHATVKGDELGSGLIEFIPGKVSAGTYKFSIGSAGSTCLVFQTILPALLNADKASKVSFEGGTHNMCAPSFEFINSCFIKALRKMNCQIDGKLQRFGFYPHGGGQWTALIQPLKNAKKLELLEKGELVSKRATSFINKIPLQVSQRELEKVRTTLAWKQDELIEQNVNSVGPGNLLSLMLNYENTTELFEQVAQPKLSAERVAGKAIKCLIDYTHSNAVVGKNLADQLLIPMIVGCGGSFITQTLSMHSLTNIDVINQFIKGAIDVENLEDGRIKVVVNNKRM
ncbi:MAG: RNA 3'-terminal phosphate cyclase [bacterium]